MATEITENTEEHRRLCDLCALCGYQVNRLTVSVQVLGLAVQVLGLVVQVLGLVVQVLGLVVQVLGLLVQVPGLVVQVLGLGVQVLGLGVQVLGLLVQVLGLGVQVLGRERRVLRGANSPGRRLPEPPRRQGAKTLCGRALAPWRLGGCSRPRERGAKRTTTSARRRDLRHPGARVEKLALTLVSETPARIDDGTLVSAARKDDEG